MLLLIMKMKREDLRLPLESFVPLREVLGYDADGKKGS